MQLLLYKNEKIIVTYTSASVPRNNRLRQYFYQCLIFLFQYSNSLINKNIHTRLFKKVIGLDLLIIKKKVLWGNLKSNDDDARCLDDI